jgi:hypothetical protein
MRTFATLFFLFSLFQICGAAAAEGSDVSSSSSRSFEAGCVQSIVKKSVADYSKVTGIATESIPADVRVELEVAVRPLHAACECLARKATAKVQPESENSMEIALDLSGLSNSAECAPAQTALIAVQRSFMQLVGESPPPVRYLKTKRIPFAVEVALNKARPSVFAAYTPPPGLTQSVFLAPGTGAACEAQDVCVDGSPLEIVKAAELLGSHGRMLGKEGSRNLQRVIDQFGGDARVITSGSNFSNFAATPRGATYAVRSIDGISIEKTTAKKVWLVFIASQVPVDPRAIDFAAATVSVVEVEFED